MLIACEGDSPPQGMSQGQLTAGDADKAATFPDGDVGEGDGSLFRGSASHNLTSPFPQRIAS